MNIMPAGMISFALGYAAVKVAEAPRTKRTIHVLRGRPIIYGIHYANGAIRPVDHLRIDTCLFEGGSDIPAIEVTRGDSSLTRLERKWARRLALANQRVRTARRPSLP